MQQETGFINKAIFWLKIKYKYIPKMAKYIILYEAYAEKKASSLYFTGDQNLNQNDRIMS